MKKYLIVLLVLILLVTGCSLFNKEKENKELAKDVILSYRLSTTESFDQPYYEVNVYADKHMTKTYSNTEGWSEVKLTDEQFQEIVDYINRDDFLSLKQDLSLAVISDGEYSEVIVYYADGTSFSVEGYEITDPVFKGLIELLNR